MGGDIGIIGGADGPTFWFLIKALLMQPIFYISTIAIIVALIFLAVWLIKKKNKHD